MDPNDQHHKEETVIEVKPLKEISASSLQNPADDTATFKRKGDEDHQGYVLNVAETIGRSMNAPGGAEAARFW